jgi:hypothetical protein
LKKNKLFKKIINEIKPVREHDSKSVIRQAYEIFRIAITAQYTPSEYYMYNIQKADRNISELARYISNTVWVEQIWSKLTKVQWEDILQNKWLFHLYFSNIGLPVTKVLGYYSQDGGLVQTGTVIENVNALINYLHEIKPDTLVIKPIYGGKGKYVVVFESLQFKNDHITGISISGKEHRLMDIIESIMTHSNRYSGFLLEEKVKQHSVFNTLNPYTTNTIRIQTFLKKSGEPVILAAVVRCGRKGSEVDNLSRGGFSRGINIQTGIVNEGGLLSDKKRNKWIEFHPDLNTPLHQVEIPYWDALVETITDFIRCTPFARMVGWDVIVSETGPVVIEGNPDMGLDIVQSHTNGLLTDELINDLNDLGVRVNRSAFNRLSLRMMHSTMRRWLNV